MVIKVLFFILIVSTAALVAVGLAIYFRMRRHLVDSKSEQEVPRATEVAAQVAGPLDSGTSED